MTPPSSTRSSLKPTGYGEFGPLAGHLAFAERAANRLGRALFHAMVRFGPKLERRQMVLFRAVDIGAELYAMAAACARAQMLAGRGETRAYALADVFCRLARGRIAQLFRTLHGPGDEGVYRLAQRVLAGEHAWLEQGIVGVSREAGAETEESRPASSQVVVGDGVHALAEVGD